MENNIFLSAYLNFLKLSKANDDRPYQIIGIFDDNNKLWYNGWAIYDPDHSGLYAKSRELLQYGLEIHKHIQKTNEEKAIIRSILVNSKFFISEKKIQLDLIVAIITYFTKTRCYNILKNDKLYIYCIYV
jgi:hypothetical protein